MKTGPSSPLDSVRIFSFPRDGFIPGRAFLHALEDFEIIILGEDHGNPRHHRNQREIIESLSSKGSVDLGIEILNWMQQAQLDLFLKGMIDEASFLESLRIGEGVDFSPYLSLIRASAASGGSVCGINAPGPLVRGLVHNGVEGLSQDARGLLPPHFEMGSDLYFQRFREAMEAVDHPMMGASLEGFFAAHSAWDDTMAHQALIDRKDGVPFIVIVGNFHAAYGLGLPARIGSRSGGALRLATVVQVDAKDLPEEEILSHTRAHPAYGNIGDFVIFTGEDRSWED